MEDIAVQVDGGVTSQSNEESDSGSDSSELSQIEDIKITTEFISSSYQPTKAKKFDMKAVKKFVDQNYPKIITELDDQRESLQIDEESDKFSSSSSSDDSIKINPHLISKDSGDKENSHSISEENSDEEELKPRAPSQYNLFVKEMLPIFKKRNPGVRIPELLMLIGQEWIKKKAELNGEPTRTIISDDETSDSESDSDKFRQTEKKNSSEPKQCEIKTVASGPTQSYENFIALLSDINSIWVDVHDVAQALDMIQHYVDANMIRYIIRKIKGAEVIGVISNNNTVDRIIRTHLIDHLVHHGIIDNEREYLFRMLSRVTTIQSKVLIQIMLRRSMDPNFQTNIGNIFHILVLELNDPPSIEELRQLVDCGCDPLAKNKMGQTPLELACDLKNKQMVDLFLRLSLYNIEPEELYQSNINKKIFLGALCCSSIALVTSLIYLLKK
jgi:hypothetical protein